MNTNTLKKNKSDFGVVFKPKPYTKEDTFSIQKVRRDPFLGTLIRTKNTTAQAKVKSIKIKHPTITYSGLIKRQNTSNRVFVINRNNKQYLLKKGQKADSIIVLGGNSQEVFIRYNDNNMTIKR